MVVLSIVLLFGYSLEKEMADEKFDSSVLPPQNTERFVATYNCVVTHDNEDAGNVTEEGANQNIIMYKAKLFNISLKMTVLKGATVMVVVGGASARVAGKVGGYSNKMGGKSTSGINEEIIWISISMAIAIAVLIAIALCYILREKCSKRKAFKEQS